MFLLNISQLLEASFITAMMLDMYSKVCLLFNQRDSNLRCTLMETWDRTLCGVWRMIIAHFFVSVTYWIGHFIFLLFLCFGPASRVSFNFMGIHILICNLQFLWFYGRNILRGTSSSEYNMCLLQKGVNIKYVPEFVWSKIKNVHF